MKKKWKKINFTDDVPESPFLLLDENGNIYPGFTAFDYYDARYWLNILPLPKLSIKPP